MAPQHEPRTALAVLCAMGVVVLLAGCDARAWVDGGPEATASPTAPRTASPTPPPTAGTLTILDGWPGFPREFTPPPTDHREEAEKYVLVYDDPRDPGVLSIVTRGSSSCPTIPTSYRITGGGALVITLVMDLTNAESTEFGYACTADLAARTTRIELPEGVDHPAAVTIDAEESDGLLEDETVPILPLPAG